MSVSHVKMVELNFLNYSYSNCWIKVRHQAIMIERESHWKMLQIIADLMNDKGSLCWNRIWHIFMQWIHSIPTEIGFSIFFLFTFQQNVLTIQKNSTHINELKKNTKTSLPLFDPIYSLESLMTVFSRCSYIGGSKHFFWHIFRWNVFSKWTNEKKEKKGKNKQSWLTMIATKIKSKNTKNEMRSANEF